MAYTSKKKYNSKNKGKVKIFLSLNILDQLILYSMSSNSLVTKKITYQLETSNWYYGWRDLQWRCNTYG